MDHELKLGDDGVFTDKAVSAVFVRDMEPLEALQIGVSLVRGAAWQLDVTDAIAKAEKSA